jgi:hypothetical protein
MLRPANEMHVGMIVTRTSEEAQAVLKALKAGMDFGVHCQGTLDRPKRGQWRLSG